MRLIKISFIFSFLISFFQVSCGMQDISGAKITGVSEINLSTEEIGTADGQERSYGVISTLASQAVRLSANKESDIVGAFAVFSPGTFAAASSSVTVAVETGEAKLYKLLFQILILQVEIQSDQSAPSVIVRPSSQVEVIEPFAVSVPLPSLGSSFYLSEDLYQDLLFYILFLMK